MNPIQTFDQLKDYTLNGCKQYWYYVILVNPLDLTPAGKALFNNMIIYHLDSGEECQYFIPGFLNTGRGLFKYGFKGIFSPKGEREVDIPNFGRLQFSGKKFAEFYLELERRNSSGWRYSGECELLLFNLSMGNKIKLNNFISYNLDDIVRNGRNVSEFIRATINVGKDVKDEVAAKRILDEKYSDMIMPQEDEINHRAFEQGWNVLQERGFCDGSYLFISYSSKDFRLVSDIRKRLMDAGVSCWMAPYDIPQGCNYALVIEHAIRHAERFVLMLSPSAAQSVWVGKELKRAISRFQLENPERISVAWLYNVFDLNGTPLALPLEDIQTTIQINSNPGNFFLLASQEKRAEMERRMKLIKNREEIKQYFAPEKISQILRDILSRVRCIHALSTGDEGPSPQLLALCEQLQSEIQSMEMAEDIRSQGFMLHYMRATELLNQISEYSELNL